MKCKVPVKYIFEGFYEIEAESKTQAQEYVVKHCGCTIGAIESTLNEEDVEWEFPVHPEIVISKSRIKII